MRPERYNARESEAKWRKAWAEAQVFTTRNDDPRPKYYVLEMFPYPSGRIHMGHVRNYAMGDVVARYRRARGLQRPPPDGVGRVRHAGGKRRDAEQHPSGDMDLRQYRRDARATAVDGAVARLVARDRDLRPELLQASAEAVSRFPARRPRVAAEVEGELGPGRPHRARQRAGDRRPRLALGRGGRAARTDPMVPEDHRLFRRPARQPRPSRPLAGKGAPDAAQLDRPLGRPDGPLRLRPRVAGSARRRTGCERTRNLHDAPRHAVRREIHGDRARPSARRRGRAARSGARRVHRGMPQGRHLGRRDRDGREEGLRHGLKGRSSFRPGLAPAGLCREFHPDGLRHRARFSAVRRTTSATSTSSTSTASARPRSSARPTSIPRPSPSTRSPTTATA